MGGGGSGQARHSCDALALLPQGSAICERYGNLTGSVVTDPVLAKAATQGTGEQGAAHEPLKSTDLNFWIPRFSQSPSQSTVAP